MAPPAAGASGAAPSISRPSLPRRTARPPPARANRGWVPPGGATLRRSPSGELALAPPEPNFIQASYGAYLEAATARPLVVKPLTGFACTIAGDALAQALSSSPAAPGRGLLLAAFSAGVSATAGHWWNEALDARIVPPPGGAPAAARAALAAKVALDQFLFTPLHTAAWLAYVAAVVERRPDVGAFVNDHLLGTLAVGWTVCPLLAAATFAWVPRDARILSGNLLGVLWTCYLILTTHGGGQ